MYGYNKNNSIINNNNNNNVNSGINKSNNKNNSKQQQQQRQHNQQQQQQLFKSVVPGTAFSLTSTVGISLLSGNLGKGKVVIKSTYFTPS
jgi:dihydroxyacid dehydratase/phosphogluconate dehydratase